MSSARGIYVSPTQFVQFAEPRQRLSDHIATRERSMDFRALGLYLPNPDPVLKKLGKDVSVYAELRGDAAVGGAIRRRKGGVVMMEWRVHKDKASTRMAKLVEQVLGNLDMRRVLREMMDAPLFGWNTLEVMWSPPTAGGPVVPVDVVGKPLSWFQFDDGGQLRFKSREQPLFGEPVPPRKFLVPAQDASYANPYGFADLSMVFWPTVFKRGGMKFWATFTEKFGMPFLVGKTPRGTPPAEQNALLGQLEAMVQDAVAVIPDDGSIEALKVDGKTGSAELYERLLMFCRSEIAIALLGQNQTTEKDSTHASATAGSDVADDLRDADARLCEATLNQLARWVVDVNEGEAAPAPKVELYEQEEVDTVQASRDEILVKAGAKLTKAYFMRTYDLEDGDIDESAAVAPPIPATAAATPPATPAGPTAAFAEAMPAPLDPMASQTQALAQAGDAVVGTLVAQLQRMVDGADTTAELQQALLDAYGGLDTAELTRLMAAAFALAELRGMDLARADGATGAAGATA